jgi:hypothetical protein
MRECIARSRRNRFRRQNLRQPVSQEDRDAGMQQAWNEVASKGTPVELSERGRVPIVLTVLRQ